MDALHDIQDSVYLIKIVDKCACDGWYYSDASGYESPFPHGKLDVEETFHYELSSIRPGHGRGLTGSQETDSPDDLGSVSKSGLESNSCGGKTELNSRIVVVIISKSTNNCKVDHERNE